MKTKLILLTLFGFGLLSVRAQSTISTAGGNATSSGGTVSYTVGQVAYSTQTSTSGTITQGVQQPFEIFVATALEQAKDISLQLQVFPNPVNDYLKLSVVPSATISIQSLSYQLYDVNGKLVQNNNVESNETNIMMSGFTSGTYLLKVNQGNTSFKTFKIIKN
jgi:hypothetical protein